MAMNCFRLPPTVSMFCRVVVSIVAFAGWGLLSPALAEEKERTNLSASAAESEKSKHDDAGNGAPTQAPPVSVSLQAVTFDLSCCHWPAYLAACFSRLLPEALAHLMFEGQGGIARRFAPFNWHSLAFDPFNLSPSAQPSTSLPRWVTSTRFLTS